MQLEYVSANPGICLERVPMGLYHNQQSDLKDQHRKILGLLKSNSIDNDLIKILSRFFTLEDERKNNEGPTLQMMEYLQALTSELLELLSQKNIREPTIKLFQVFVRFNFNKENLYKYYRNKIENQLCSHKGREMEILVRWAIESKTPVRNDMAYNNLGNTLSSDIGIEIEKQKLYYNQHYGIYRPVGFSVPGVVYVAIIAVLMRIGIIENTGSLKSFYKTIRNITRGPENKDYEFTTIRNYFKLDDIDSLRKVEEIFAEAIGYIREREEELIK